MLLIIIEKSKHRDVYSGYDTLPLQILFVYFLALPSLLHPSILFNCFDIVIIYYVKHKNADYTNFIYHNNYNTHYIVLE